MKPTTDEMELVSSVGWFHPWLNVAFHRGSFKPRTATIIWHHRSSRMSSQDDTVDESIPTIEKLAAKFFGPDPPLVQIEFGALSDRGHRRQNNEDHFAV